jgi:hypothetical protein
MPLQPDVPFNLYNFRQVIGDPARPFLFLIHIPEVGTDQTMTAMARSTKLPGQTLGSIDIPFQGVNIKVGGTPTFQDWDVTFLCDEAHQLRRIFFTWQTLAYDIGLGNVGHSNMYKSDQIGVAQLARDGEQVSLFGLVGAWPKAVGDIEVGHDQNATFESFPVTFSMDYFRVVDQFGTQAMANSFVNSSTSVQISRGSPPPNGAWTTPFNPQ